MTWRPGESGMRRPRLCNATLLEEAECVRARDAVLPPGVERAVVRAGVCWQPRLVCPMCGSSRRFLYAPGNSAFGCRSCHRLDHTVRHSTGRAEPRTAA